MGNTTLLAGPHRAQRCALFTVHSKCCWLTGWVLVLPTVRAHCVFKKQFVLSHLFALQWQHHPQAASRSHGTAFLHGVCTHAAPSSWRKYVQVQVLDMAAQRITTPCGDQPSAYLEHMYTFHPTQIAEL